MYSSRSNKNIMYKLCRPDESKDLFAYYEEEVKCDCEFRASRLMTPNFEKYFKFPFYKCNFEKKLEVVMSGNSVRCEMRATMEAKFVEKDAEMAAQGVEWEVEKEAIISLKGRYINALTTDLEDLKFDLRGHGTGKCVKRGRF